MYAYLLGYLTLKQLLYFKRVLFDETDEEKLKQR